MVIAIKNETGDIYRREVIDGLAQLLELDDILSDLELVNETLQGARKLKGIEAVFGRGRDLSLDAVLAQLNVKGR